MANWQSAAIGGKPASDLVTQPARPDYRQNSYNCTFRPTKLFAKISLAVSINSNKQENRGALDLNVNICFSNFLLFRRTKNRSQK